MAQVTRKTCAKCGEDKPLDVFHAGRARCKACRSEEARAWRIANSEMHAANRYRYIGSEAAFKRGNYQRHADAYAARQRSRAEALAARTEEQMLADQARLRPTGAKRCRRCLSSLPLANFSRARRTSDGLADSCRPCSNNSRHLLRKAMPHWEALGINPRTCTYCGVALDSTAAQLHVDHVVPVAAGGTDDPSNLVPACRSCNCSKGDKPLSDWLPTRPAYRAEPTHTPQSEPLSSE